MNPRDREPFFRDVVDLDDVLRVTVDGFARRELAYLALTGRLADALRDRLAFRLNTWPAVESREWIATPSFERFDVGVVSRRRVPTAIVQVLSFDASDVLDDVRWSGVREAIEDERNACASRSAVAAADTALLVAIFATEGNPSSMVLRTLPRAVDVKRAPRDAAGDLARAMERVTTSFAEAKRVSSARRQLVEPMFGLRCALGWIRLSLSRGR